MEAPSTTPSMSRGTRLWREWRGFALFIVIMLLFRSAVADWNHVPTSSMVPSILEGDRIVVDKLAYDLRIPFTLMRLASWADPQRSDVVTFESPKDGRMLVKRVIGVPGDTVQLVNNRLVVNGESATYEPIELSASVTAALEAAGLERFEVVRETLLGQSRTIMSHRRYQAPLMRSFAPVEVPQGQYLVLGDNRDNSQDSRIIGFVERELILGRAHHIAFSLDQENYYIPRTNRFLEDLD